MRKRDIEGGTRLTDALRTDSGGRNSTISIKRHLRSCKDCQYRHRQREKEPLTSTSVSRLFQKICIDLVHMGKGSGQFPYLIVARDDLSGWAEARPLRRKESKDVAKFLWEDVISRMGVIGWITTDNGTEVMGAVDLLVERYEVPHITTAAYNPKANALVERGHEQLVEAILKSCRGRASTWHQHLHAALWADRITTKTHNGLLTLRARLRCHPLSFLSIYACGPGWGLSGRTGCRRRRSWRHGFGSWSGGRRTRSAPSLA